MKKQKPKTRNQVLRLFIYYCNDINQPVGLLEDDLIEMDRTPISKKLINKILPYGTPGAYGAPGVFCLAKEIDGKTYIQEAKHSGYYYDKETGKLLPRDITGMRCCWGSPTSMGWVSYDLLWDILTFARKSVQLSKQPSKRNEQIGRAHV